jgi:hypothetical protein
MGLSQQIKLAYAAKKVREDIAKNKNDEVEGWKIWNPYPIQKKLIDCRADIIGFGGSGGGGKALG